MTDAKKSGRRSTYRPEFAEIARNLAMLGLTDEQIAKHFGTSRSTISLWKNKHDDFKDALAKSRDIAAAEVANALFSRAIGAEWEEEQAIKIRVSQYEERVEVVTVKRKAPPDTMAIMYFLNNRKRDLWKRNPEAGSDGDDSPLPTKVVIQVIDAGDPDAEAQ